MDHHNPGLLTSLSGLLSSNRWFGKSTSTVGTTTWVFNLHADAHDFTYESDGAMQSRQVFAANLAHLAVVFVWIGGMHFHGAFFSNYQEWLNDATLPPTSQQVSNIANQSILNPVLVTSGWFNLWLAEGVTSQFQLECIGAGALFAALLSILGSYYHLHAGTSFKRILQSKLSSVLTHHYIVLLGLGSIAWAGHLYHISVPINALLSSQACTVSDLPEPYVLLFTNPFSLAGGDPIVQSLFLAATHHLAIGIVAILAGNLTNWFKLPAINYSWHNLLGIQLFTTGSASIFASFQLTSFTVYPYLLEHHPTVVSLFVHHMWIGGFFLVGAFAHFSIAVVRDFSRFQFEFERVLIAQRDIITGHLIWVVTFLGCHSFGVFIHNDTMLALGRPSDCFSDLAIPLQTLFAQWYFNVVSTSASAGIQLATSDFMVTHIHAFTIVTTVLVLVKGVLYSRSSRLVSDKHRLGFRYPCDGPGRGGTCQISPWDHVFLGLFWMYNSISIVIFHFFWSYQSNLGALTDPSYSAFALNGNNVNGWLRNFLWSGAAQVLQAYGSNLAAYTHIFLLSHFVWALSLMFLFSGRGYWQELIESIVWAHNKLYLTMSLQPRALSITSGRAVGVTHYLLGGIGTTWAFFLSRIIATKL